MLTTMSPEAAIRLVEELWPTQSADFLLETRWEIEGGITADTPRDQLLKRTAVMAALLKVAVARSFAQTQRAQLTEDDVLVTTWAAEDAWEQSLFLAGKRK